MEIFVVEDKISKVLSYLKFINHIYPQWVLLKCTSFYDKFPWLIYSKIYHEWQNQILPCILLDMSLGITLDYINIYLIIIKFPEKCHMLKLHEFIIIIQKLLEKY